MTSITPEKGLIVGAGIEISWPPTANGAPITGASANITLTIEEPGEEAITKTGADLTEVAGVYSYVHKTTAVGKTLGKWVYDPAGNADGIEQFYFWVDEVVV